MPSKLPIKLDFVTRWMLREIPRGHEVHVGVQLKMVAEK